MDNGNCSLLELLYLSSAFDTVDHSILTNLLDYSFGFRNSALSWTKSYLADRQQFVQIGTAVSSTLHLASSVPQGSLVLGPLLFTVYTSSIFSIVNLSQHQPTTVCR